MTPRPLPTGISHSVEGLLPFARIRLIVADLDGTLLDAKEEIWDPIIRLKRSITGHYEVKLTIATGRTLKGVENLLAALKISKNVPLILYNGSIVTISEDHKTLIKKNIPLESLKQLFETAKGEQVQILAYCFKNPRSGKAKTSLSSSDFESVTGWSEIDRPVRESNGMPVKWLDWGDCQDLASPSAIIINTMNSLASENLLRKVHNKTPEVTITQSRSGSLELRPMGSDKGKALAQICPFLGYSSEEILAIGNDDNDAELLAFAGIGVAVRNSSNKAAKNSDYVTEYDSAGGTKQALYLVREAKRYAKDRSFGRRVKETDDALE